METYYLLLDKDTGRVSIAWKVFHVTMLVFIIISGFITAFLFGIGLRGFGNNCVLYADMAFLNTTNTTTTTLSPLRMFSLTTVALPDSLKPLDLSLTNWNQMRLCYFCQSMPIVSMLSAIIWVTLFMVCSRGGTGYVTDTYSRPWRIVYPALIYSVSATIATLVSSIELYRGIRAFCSQFIHVFNTDSCIKEIDNYTAYFTNRPVSAISFLFYSSISSWFCCVFWLLHSFVLLLRILCIVDFRMVQVIVFPKNDAEEGSAVEKKITKYGPGKKKNNVIDVSMFNKENKKEDEVKLATNERSPSFNFVDDSPYKEENKEFSLNTMEKHIDDLQSKSNVEDETAFHAPRADLSSL